MHLILQVTISVSCVTSFAQCVGPGRGKASYVRVLPGRRDCLHTVSTGLQSGVYSDSTSHTPEALLSDSTKTSMNDDRAFRIPVRNTLSAENTINFKKKK